MRLLLLSLLALTACSVGPRAQNHPLGRAPAGAGVIVDMRTTRVTGELLAADTNGIVVLDSVRIVRVHPRTVSSVAVRRGPSARIRHEPARYLAVRERLAAWSRYPQGITPEIERRLLDAYQLAAIRELGE